MKRLFLAGVLLALATSAHAQQATTVATCGTLLGPLFPLGSIQELTQDQNGNLCTNASGGGGGGAVTAAPGAYAAGSIVDLGPIGTLFDGLTGPSTGTLNALTALVSIYDTLQNAGKIVGNSGSTLDAAAGSDPAHAVSVQGISGMTPLAVNSTPVVNVTPTNCSGTITSGGAAQNAIAATATIHGFTLANIDSSAGSGEPLWFSMTTTAAASTTASYPLPAPASTTFSGYGTFTTPPGLGINHAVSVIAATTGHKFSCTYW